MELKSSKKIFNNYKCDYPENTIRRVIDGFDKIGINPIYNQIEIKSKDFSNYFGELLIEELGFLTCGKGYSCNLAKASAYAEMAERISSGFFVFNTITSNIEEYTRHLEGLIERKFLKGYLETTDSNLINIENINKYLEKKISNEEFQTLSDQRLFDVFVDSYSFSSEEYVKIPVRFIEVITGSSGLAAGNTIEEALVQGICEIFERYTTYKILSERIECPTISIESIHDEKVHDYIGLYKSMNVEVIIKDFSLDKDLPVIGVVFINHNIENDENELKKDFYYRMIDVGSHPDINHAVLRCLVERLQSVTKEEFMFRKKCDMPYNFWTKELKKQYNKTSEVFKDLFINYESCIDISFLERGNEVSLDELTSINNTDCLDDVMALKGICDKNNWDLQAIDYTHKVLKFPTLRVIIPSISTAYDQFILNALKIEDFKKRLDRLYGINDFYKYAVEDDWISNNDEIKILVNNIERALSKNPLAYRFYIRQGHFLNLLNLFEILAFSNLSLGNYDESLKYFEFLLKLNDKPAHFTTRLNELLNPGYNPTLFSDYKEQISRGLENNEPPTFSYKSNPFKPKTIVKELEEFFNKFLIDLNKSYFA